MAQPEFTLRAVNGELDKATVVSFRGNESISSCFRFDILVKIPDNDTVDLDAMLATDVTFSIVLDGAVHNRHGILQSFEMQQTAGGYSYYTASLVPHAWRLSLYPTNEVFVGPDFRTVEQIIDGVLTRGGFSSGTDFDLSGLTAAYAERQYTCQFGETDLAFIRRLMERDGIWFHFEHSGDTDMLVLRDDANYAALPGNPVTFGTQPDGSNRYRSIRSWVCRKQRLANEVVLRDYNYLQPSLDVSGTATVDPDGQGSVFIYGENFESAEEGARLARVRADELACRKTVFHGESGVPSFTAGSTFTLTGNPAQGGAWNDLPYLLTEVTHDGENLDNPVGAEKNAPRYTNTFSAIPGDVQFRPERRTPKPRFDGTMTGVVYAENAAATLAEVDETGHYRVRLPFDRAGSNEQKASHWIRMAQPYAGAEQGMFFPLKVNTEVLLTFLNGDPDRPVIAGAVPNGATVSLLRSDTANQATIATPDLLKLQAGGGFHVRVETDGFTGEDHAFTALTDSGASNGAMSAEQEVGGDYIIERRYGPKYVWTDGNTYNWGNGKTFEFGNSNTEVHASAMTADSETFSNPDMNAAEASGTALIEKVWGDQYEYHNGREYNWSEGPGPGNSMQTFNYGNGYSENLQRSTSGTISHSRATHMMDKIDVSIASMEKTDGDTYSYQNGTAVDVHEGDSHAETWGDSREVVHGNQYSEVHGNVDDIHWGGKNEQFMGGVSSLMLGASNELKLSVENSIVGGAKNEIFLGAASSIAIAATFEMNLGPSVEFEGTGRFSLKPVNTEVAATAMENRIAALETKATAIETHATAIKTCVTKINSVITELDTSTITIQTGGLKIFA